MKTPETFEQIIDKNWPEAFTQLNNQQFRMLMGVMSAVKDQYTSQFFTEQQVREAIKLARLGTIKDIGGHYSVLEFISKHESEEIIGMVKEQSKPQSE